jgi:hypothetical protein
MAVMDRAPRTVLLLAFLAAAPVLVAAPWAFAGMADPEGPTVNFTATGAAPLACGSRPNVSSLRVKTGTKIIFANLTDTAAALIVGGAPVVALEPGMGAVVNLKQGQHEVSLTPQCLVVTGVEAVVVSVLSGSEMGEPDLSDSTAPPGILVAPGGGSAPPNTGGSVPVPGASGAGPSAATSVGTSVGSSVGSSVGPRGTPTLTASALPVANPRADDSGDQPMESAVIDVKSIPLGDPRDPKGGRLLAVIAAICVIGVTAAIIRAIVSQRTSSAVSS